MSPRVRRVVGLRIAAPVYGPYRMTIPVREALMLAGSRITPMPLDAPVSAARWDAYEVAVLGTMPAGIRECLIGHGVDQHRGLRLSDEPEYPGEWADARGVAWHEHGQWVPCPLPRCGRPLVWYEAGYVAGYRVCTAGHHAQLAANGRSAKVVREVIE
jgi:hypothetical protein